MQFLHTLTITMLFQLYYNVTPNIYAICTVYNKHTREAYRDNHVNMPSHHFDRKSSDNVFFVLLNVLTFFPLKIRLATTLRDAEYVGPLLSQSDSSDSPRQFPRGC